MLYEYDVGILKSLSYFLNHSVENGYTPKKARADYERKFIIKMYKNNVSFMEYPLLKAMEDEISVWIRWLVPAS